jgi:hypothetical protein
MTPKERWAQQTGKYLTQKEGTYVMGKFIQIHHLSSITPILSDATESKQQQHLEDK